MWHARSTMPPVLRRARVYVSRLVVRPDVWMVLVVFSRFSGPRGVERHDYPRPHLLWSGPGVFVRVSWKGTHVVASFRSQYTHTRSLQSTVLVPACHANTMMWSMCFVLTRWRDAPSFGHACRVSFGMGPHKQLNTTTTKKTAAGYVRQAGGRQDSDYVGGRPRRAAFPKLVVWSHLGWDCGGESLELSYEQMTTADCILVYIVRTKYGIYHRYFFFELSIFDFRFSIFDFFSPTFFRENWYTWDSTWDSPAGFVSAVSAARRSTFRLVCCFARQRCIIHGYVV